MKKAKTSKKTKTTKSKKDAKLAFKPFVVSDYLTSEEVINEYLIAAAEDPNPEVFLLALNNVAKARGMAKVAKSAGLGRESLYKALSAGAHPRFETISAVMNALGVRFTVAPVTK